MERKYQNPPIVEVICEFRFLSEQQWDPTVYGLIFQRVKEEYPERETVRQIKGRVVPSSQPGMRQEIEISEAMRFWRKDRQALIHIAPNLLSINHLKPYPHWENFLPLIKQGLEAYIEVASPSGLERIGLRYINRICIPGQGIRIEEYFNYKPDLPEGLPNELSSLTVRVEGIYENRRDHLRLILSSLAPEAPEEEGSSVFLLDLDYFTAEAGAVELSQVEEWLNVAHTHILTAFEASLTERTKALFDEVPS